MVFIQFTIPPSAYEIESLNIEIERINIEGEHYTEVDYPFTIKPNFSTHGSIIRISTQGPINTFVTDDSIKEFVVFKKTTINGKYNLPPNRVDILSFENILFECDITQVIIFKGRRSSIILYFTMDVDPGYKFIENFRGGNQWCMIESKHIISSICLKMKKEISNLVSFKGQSFPFRLSIEEILLDVNLHFKEYVIQINLYFIHLYE